MYSKEFESKIKRYVGNGNISPQQREELHEEAEEYKIDDEELDIVIDGYIYLAQHQMLDNATAYRVDSQKQKIDEPSVEYPTDEGFNFKDFSADRLREANRMHKHFKFLAVNFVHFVCSSSLSW